MNAAGRVLKRCRGIEDDFVSEESRVVDGLHKVHPYMKSVEISVGKGHFQAHWIDSYDSMTAMLANSIVVRPPTFYPLPVPNLTFLPDLSSSSTNVSWILNYVSEEKAFNCIIKLISTWLGTSDNTSIANNLVRIVLCVVDYSCARGRGIR